MQNQHVWAGAIALGVIALGGAFSPTLAQVNALSVQAFDSTTGQLTLTHARGKITVPACPCTTPDTSSEALFLEFMGPVDISIASNPHGIVAAEVSPLFLLPISATLTGFVGNVQHTVSGDFLYFGFDNTVTTAGLGQAPQSPLSGNARGFLFDAELGTPFPEEFTFSPSGDR